MTGELLKIFFSEVHTFTNIIDIYCITADVNKFIILSRTFADPKTYNLDGIVTIHINNNDV